MGRPFISYPEGEVGDFGAEFLILLVEFRELGVDSD